MSKKEKIEDLIKNTDKSFEEIVVESEAKASYVKSIFTQLDLKWEDRDAEGIKLKTIIVEEDTEIEEVSDEDIPEDAEVIEEGVEIIEEDTEIKEPVDCSELIKKTEEAYTAAYRSYKSIEARILKTVLDDLKADSLGSNEGMIRRMLKMHVRSMLQKRMFAKTAEITDEYFELIK